MLTFSNYINGELRPALSGQTLAVFEPATGQVYAQVPDSTSEDVARAYDAAQAAFPGWAATSADDRAQLLLRIADRIEARMEELAQAESRDNGKPVALARRMDIPRARDNFRYFAHAITQFHSETYDMGTLGHNYVLRRPVGVVGLISPWNLPLYLFSWKIAPALAAGCTAVAKPSEITPFTAHLLAEICIEAGLPAGVLNIVHGTGPQVGEAIVNHPHIHALSFTGSTVVGRRIATLAAPMFKKLSLEMGGKNPTLVFADCDYQETLNGVSRASFTNQGQICLCGSRILVEDSLYDRFVPDLVEAVRTLRVGDPLEETSEVGAIVSQVQLEKDLKYIQLAREEGGQILCGGEAVTVAGERCRNGWFLQPTIIAGLSQTCRVNQEEIFGPVVTVQRFSTEAEAIALANDTAYGLSATVWTGGLKRAHRVAAQLEAGIVWVNSWLVRDLRTPFGGVKQSGVGREGGMEALRFFTEPKNVFIRL